MSLRFVREVPDLDLATRIASSGFVQPLSSALRLDVDSHLKEGQIVYSIFKGDSLIGFAIFCKMTLPAVFPGRAGDWGGSIYEDMNVLYLAGIMLHDSMQGQGIAEQAVLHARKELETHISYFALRTESLRMWSAGKKMTESWFPNPQNSFPGQFRVAKTLLAERMQMKLDKDFSSSGFYGAPLYGTKPLHHDANLQAWWDGICSFERGDAVLCIGRFK